MKELLKILDSQAAGSLDPNGKTQVRNFGLISCGNTVHIRHVPFDSPCIILVLSGRKLMFEKGREIICEAGSVLTIPGPESYDLRNEPNPRTGRYRALVIPFESSDLERLQQMHRLTLQGSEDLPRILYFDKNTELNAALENYLRNDNDEYLLNHRLLEVLLILTQQDRRLLTYTLSAINWNQRVRAVLAVDLSKKWEINEVCRQLATSESALRRHLKNEQTGFRDLLGEQRLTKALMQLLQTSSPVTQVAYDCGYQSVSRFSSNFRKRFGLPPAAFRESMNENGQHLAVSGQLIND